MSDEYCLSSLYLVSSESSDFVLMELLLEMGAILGEYYRFMPDASR